MLTSKLTAESLKFISNVNITVTSNKKVNALSAARAISSMLVVPMAKVENIRGYYNTSSRIDVEKMVSALNEVILLDVEDVLDTVYKLYTYRYETAQGGLPPVCFASDCAIEGLFGISRYFDNETIKVLKEKTSDISINTLGFVKVLQDLRS
jgi:hypothetical protein